MTATYTKGQLYHVKLHEIRPSERNVRTAGRMGEIDELATSILSMGIIQPLVISTDGEIVAGHRRYAALEKLENERKLIDYEIPCIVRDVDLDADMTSSMLIENLQRLDLNPVEEARGIERLHNEGLKQKDIALRIGKSPSLVSHRLRMMHLPVWVLQLLEDEVITLQHIDVLLPLAQDDDWWAMLEIMGGIEGMSVRQLEHEVHQWNLKRIQMDAEMVVVSAGGRVCESHQAMRDMNLRIDYETQLSEPSDDEITKFVQPDEVYRVAVSYEGKLIVQHTLPSEGDNKSSKGEDEETKMFKRAKKARAAKLAELIPAHTLTAGEQWEMVGAYFAARLGEVDIKWVARVLGFTGEDSKAWRDQLEEAITSGGVSRGRIILGILCAHNEGTRNFQHGKQEAYRDFLETHLDLRLDDYGEPLSD